MAPQKRGKTIDPSLASIGLSNPNNIHPRMPQIRRDLVVAIQKLLNDKGRFEFEICVICFAYLAKPQNRRTNPFRDLQNLLQTNPQMWRLYREYANEQRANESEDRFRLPSLEELVEDEAAENVDGREIEAADDGSGGDDGNNEMEVEQGSEIMDVDDDNNQDEDGDEDEDDLTGVSDRSVALGKEVLAQIGNRDTREESPASGLEQEHLNDADLPTASIEPNDFLSPKKTKQAPKPIKAGCNPERTPTDPAITAAQSSRAEPTSTRKRQLSSPASRGGNSSLPRRAPAVKRPRFPPTILSEPSSQVQDAPVDGAAPSAPTVQGDLDPSSPGSATPAPVVEIMIPITNPKSFPIMRIRLVQEERHVATIVRAWSHRDLDGNVVKFSADMHNGPVNHIWIDDCRILTALGLRTGKKNEIELREDHFRHQETFMFEIPHTAKAKDLTGLLSGRLVPARHAYLYWLDRRGTADPTSAPFMKEANHIALWLDRRTEDVWEEIQGYWELEHGEAGRIYRKNRALYLGEDPAYTKEQAEAGR